MKIRKTILTGLSIGVLSLVLSLGGGAAGSFVGTNTIYAAGIDNDFGERSPNKSTREVSTNPTGVSVNADDIGNVLDKGNLTTDDIEVGNFIKNHRGMTGSQLEKASEVVSPLTSIIGYLVGGIIAICSAGIFLITAIDILYISFPPIRGLLYTPGTDGTGAMTAGRFGGGFGMGGMHGGAMGNQQTKRSIQIISDEAVQCAALFGGSSMSEGIGGMPRNGMGFGMQPQNQMSRGSVIKQYLFKRAVFIVLFAICIIILTSSVLLGTGVNIAHWGIKLIDAFNSFLAF